MSNPTLTDEQREWLSRGKFIVGEDAYGLCLECEDGQPVFYDSAADILNAAREMDAEIERLKGVVFDAYYEGQGHHDGWFEFSKAAKAIGADDDD